MTIAGSDPGGGAGLQADLKTFAALNVYGFSVITAVIVQNSSRVGRVVPVNADIVLAQIETLLEERPPDALKIGALATAANVIAVASAIRASHLPPPVIDPVLLSTSGARLLDSAGEKALRAELIPLARLVTPNIPEAEALTGISIDGPGAMRAAARALHRAGAHSVVIKGGHPFAGTGDTALNARVTDLFFDGRKFVELTSPRISFFNIGRTTDARVAREMSEANAGLVTVIEKTHARIAGDSRDRRAGLATAIEISVHGTGCAFSAAIAAHLARGAHLETAVRHAKTFVTRALRQSFVLGSGRPLLDHFARR